MGFCGVAIALVTLPTGCRITFESMVVGVTSTSGAGNGGALNQLGNPAWHFLVEGLVRPNGVEPRHVEQRIPARIEAIRKQHKCNTGSKLRTLSGDETRVEPQPATRSEGRRRGALHAAKCIVLVGANGRSEQRFSRIRRYNWATAFQQSTRSCC